MLRWNTRARSAAVIAAAAVLMLVATSAHTAPVQIDDVVLTGPQGTEWDAEGDEDYGSGGPCIAREGFTPVEDGENDYSSDAFDGGLYLVVNGKTFGRGIETGNLSGQQLRVGPQRIGRVAITRIERALQTSPTLRSLVRFKNATNRDRVLTLVWDSAMGADDAEATRASSAKPNLRHTREDRWIVASDNASSASLSDPPVTFVFYGKNAPMKVRRVIHAPEDPDPDGSDREGCVSVRYRIKIPAKSTRFMLFFTELGLSNEASINAAAKFNRQKLNNKLLTGIGPRVRSRILNWNLG
jgi:hypothetical protein